MIERMVALAVVAGIVAFFGFIVVAGIIASLRGDRRLPRRPRRSESERPAIEDQDAAE